jgi:hypothetical protein
VLTLVGLAAAFLLGLGVLLPLVPTLILMAMAPLVAVVGAILAGRGLQVVWVGCAKSLACSPPVRRLPFQ